MLCVENLLETLCKLELWINFSLGLRHGWCPCKYKGKLLWTPGALPCVCSAMANARQPHGLQPTRLLCPWDVPGKNTTVDSISSSRGIFLIQGSNPHFLHLLHWEADSLLLSHLGSPGCQLPTSNPGRFSMLSSDYSGLLFP